jgi:hypothetical protein
LLSSSRVAVAGKAIGRLREFATGEARDTRPRTRRLPTHYGAFLGFARRGVRHPRARHFVATTEASAPGRMGKRLRNLQTPNASALKQFLLHALRQSPSFAALQENGGQAWWIDQTYSEPLERLKRLLTTQFQETGSRRQAR